MEFFKKGSYYLAFFFFYFSLYGFIYSLNMLYNFSYFSEIFHYITIIISFIITGLFFFFFKKRYETLFLIFRSNCIIFTTIYSFLLIFFLIENKSPNLIFIINSIYPIITLLSVLIYDSFIREKNKYIYLFFLLYGFLIGNYYLFFIFPNLTMRQIVLIMTVILMSVCIFIIPYIGNFYRFVFLSKKIGITTGYITSFFIIFSIITGSFSLFYGSMLGITLMLHYLIYKKFKNYVSYSILFITLIFLYVEIFLFLKYTSFLSILVFIFLLPYLFIGASYVVYMESLKKLYITLFIGISSHILFLLYYSIQANFFSDMFSLSIVLFLESILLFMSYMRLKK